MVRFWPNEAKSDIVKGIVRFFYVIGSRMNNSLKIRLFLGLIMGLSLLSPVYCMQMHMARPQEIQVDIQPEEYISPRASSRTKSPQNKFVDVEVQNKRLHNDRCAKTFICVMAVAFLGGLGYGMHVIGMLDS